MIELQENDRRKHTIKGFQIRIKSFFIKRNNINRNTLGEKMFHKVIENIKEVNRIYLEELPKTILLIENVRRKDYPKIHLLIHYGIEMLGESTPFPNVYKETIITAQHYSGIIFSDEEERILKETDFGLVKVNTVIRNISENSTTVLFNVEELEQYTKSLFKKEFEKVNTEVVFDL